jgi:hypothetical protein
MIKIKNEPEHIQFAELVKRLETSGDYLTRKYYFNKLKEELLAEMEIEDIEAENFISHTNSEHHQIKEHLQRLNLIKFNSPEWGHEFSLLKNFIEH